MVKGHFEYALPWRDRSTNIDLARGFPILFFSQ